MNKLLFVFKAVNKLLFRPKSHLIMNIRPVFVLELSQTEKLFHFGHQSCHLGQLSASIQYFIDFLWTKASKGKLKVDFPHYENHHNRKMCLKCFHDHHLLPFRIQSGVQSALFSQFSLSFISFFFFSLSQQLWAHTPFKSRCRFQIHSFHSFFLLFYFTFQMTSVAYDQQCCNHHCSCRCRCIKLPSKKRGNQANNKIKKSFLNENENFHPIHIGFFNSQAQFFQIESRL